MQRDFFITENYFYKAASMKIRLMATPTAKPIHPDFLAVGRETQKRQCAFFSTGIPTEAKEVETACSTNAVILMVQIHKSQFHC